MHLGYEDNAKIWKAALDMPYNSGMLISRLRAIMLLSAGLAVAHAEGTPAKAFRIENLECKGIACDLHEGRQAGQTTVEAHGDYRGVDSVRMKVLRREPKELVLDKTIPTMSHGKLTISVPAYELADGDYVIRIAAADVPRPLAVGAFRKSSGDAPPTPEPKAAANANIVGEWKGVKNTGGVLTITADGKYKTNGGSGEYRVSGKQITFTGPLTIWNGGRAVLKEGMIEFSWTNARGAKRLYSFAKSR